MMSAFEKKYGDIIPTLRGDFTEYWTDSLGSEYTWYSLDDPTFESGNLSANIIGAAIHNFRYRLPPHQSGYDAVRASRFGLDQAQLLIASPVNERVSINAPVKIDNDRVFISIVKTSSDG